MQSLTARALAQRGAASLVRCPAWTSPCVFLLPMPAVLHRRAVPAIAAGPRAAAPAPAFSTTAAQRKKGGGGGGGGGKKDKRDNKRDKASEAPDAGGKDDAADDGSGGTHPAPDPADPFSFADVESRWQRSDAHHEEKFKELQRTFRGGLGGGAGGAGGGADGEGGVDVDAIGATPVVVRDEGGRESQGKGGAKGKKHAHAHAHAHEAGGADKDAAAVPLSQLALILPRPGGRVVELRMHSPASRKAIVSAVQASPLFHGQQPQPDADDELVLLVKLGSGGGGESGSGSGGGGGAAAPGGGAAAAAEAAAARTRRVHDLANAWRAQIRRATARRQKTHQAWKKDKTVQPDDLHRLERELLKGQEKRMARIDAAEKEALRQLERTARR